jgi:hypothetical protein
VLCVCIVFDKLNNSSGPISTPMSSALGTPAANEPVGSKVASGAMRMARGATTTIMNGASKVNHFVADNHWSLKALSLTGFLAVFGFSVAALVGYKLETGLNSKYVMNIYMIFFSMVNLLSEASDNWPVFGSVRQFMFSQFGFLKHNLGRGFYNVFFGLIFASLWPFPVYFVGIFVSFVGLLFMAAHRRGAPEPGRHIEMQEDLEGGRH